MLSAERGDRRGSSGRAASGNGDGSGDAVPWGDSTHLLCDEQQRTRTCVDTGRTRPTPVGTPARVFAHRSDDGTPRADERQ